MATETATSAIGGRRKVASRATASGGAGAAAGATSPDVDATFLDHADRALELLAEEIEVDGVEVELVDRWHSLGSGYAFDQRVLLGLFGQVLLRLRRQQEREQPLGLLGLVGGVEHGAGGDDE